MKLISVLFAASAVFVSCRIGTAGEPLKLVSVASYLNEDEALKTVGVRVMAILSAQNIKSMAVGSSRINVSVPSDKAAEALEILAKAIKAEKLDLNLLVRKGDRYVVVTPDSVLESKKTH